MREDTRERIRFGLLAFGAFVLSALVVGWLMYPFPPEPGPWPPRQLWGPVGRLDGRDLRRLVAAELPHCRTDVPDWISHPVAYLVLAVLCCRGAGRRAGALALAPSPWPWCPRHALYGVTRRMAPVVRAGPALPTRATW